MPATGKATNASHAIAGFQVVATLAANVLLYLLLIAVRAAFAPFVWFDLWCCLFVLAGNVMNWAIIGLRDERRRLTEGG